jgi:hypothetical protein
MLMRKYGLLFLVVSLGSVALPAAVGAESGLRLRLVPVAQGVSDEPDIIDAGQAAGVDVRQPAHPLLIHAYAGGRLFYVFYKTVDEATGPKQYLLQRIHKTERFYASPDDRNPRVQESYLVEAFKLRDGTLKRPDQHFGSFGLGDCYRREVVKEYEIGFGELEGVATGDEWPFQRRFLYHAIHSYESDRSLYDQVKFTQSKRWTLKVTFDQGGSYCVSCPELGFDAPRALPAPVGAETNAKATAQAIGLKPPE